MKIFSTFVQKYKINLFYDNEAPTIREILEDIIKSYFNEVEHEEI